MSTSEAVAAVALLLCAATSLRRGCDHETSAAAARTNTFIFHEEEPPTMRAFQEWKDDILHHKGEILLALLFFALSILSTIVSSNYVDETRTAPVPDLLLDALPVVNLSLLFIWGAVLVFVLYLLYPLVFEPKRFHYALGMLGLFLLVRSGFVVLTHLRAPIGAINVVTPGFLGILSYSNDLFFSGHTGLPFLGYLVFTQPWMKRFMLGASIVLAATVLLMHVHYSIDVASAYFITYGVFVIGTPLFEGTEAKA